MYEFSGEHFLKGLETHAEMRQTDFKTNNNNNKLKLTDLCILSMCSTELSTPQGFLYTVVLLNTLSVPCAASVSRDIKNPVMDQYFLYLVFLIIKKSCKFHQFAIKGVYKLQGRNN